MPARPSARSSAASPDFPWEQRSRRRRRPYPWYSHVPAVEEISGLELGRNLAAILGELGHDLLVQPDVHGGGVVHVAAVFELLSELLACRQAAVEIQELHQV